MAKVLGWGKASSGELGIGDSDLNSVTAPCVINTLKDTEIKNISCGETHTLVCSQDGKVYSSGGNDFMQCGRDRNFARFEPIEKGLETQHVIEVAAGSFHSTALTQAGEVFTWGKNDSGQLGRGNVEEEAQGIPRLLESLHSHCVLQVSCGSDHTIISTNIGLVASWGSNTYGQLGVGQHTCPYLNQPEFVSCLKGIPVAQVAAGGNHSFMLSTSGAVYGWGRNDFGQLGLNDTDDHYLPKQCRDLRNKQVKYISCGENHTACLTVVGQVFLFGAGGYGQLGHKIKNNVILAQAMLDLSATEGEDFEVSQIACGRNHTLVYVPSSGHLYSFGLGGSGQLGISTSDNKSTPVIVQELFSPLNKPTLNFLMQSNKKGQSLMIKTIYAGGDHSFAVAMDRNMCQSDDFRVKNKTRQTLSISVNKSEKIFSTPGGGQLLRDVVQLFSHAPCLNGSFLSQKNNEHYGSNSKKHGVDINAVRTFFTQLRDLQDSALNEQVLTGIKQLIANLPRSPGDVEMLRVYLILPECHLFEEPKLYSSVICPFANSFIMLDKIAQRVVETWWLSMEQSFFKSLVTIYQRCLKSLLSLDDTTDIAEALIRNAGLLSSMEMLKKLHKVSDDNNEFVRHQAFYIHGLRDYVNIENDYFKWITDPEGTKGIIFWNYPFLYDAADKSVLLQIDSSLQMVSAVQDAQEKAFIDAILGQERPEQLFNPQRLLLVLKVSRENLVQDTFRQLQGKTREIFKRPLRVSFVGEEGMDEGGVRKEFLILLFQSIMSPEYGMFKTMEDTDFLWFDTNSEKEPDMYHMTGILCGLAIYNNILIDLPFPLVLYKKLLNRPVSLDDMEEFMPVPKRNLQGVLNYEVTYDSEEIYGLTFEYMDKELCADGANRPVTQENKKEFVDLAVDFILNKSIEVQFRAFSVGFNSVCASHVYNSLHPEELQSLLVGNESYDFKMFEQVTQYKDNYSKDHPTIKYFWEVFHEMTLEKKKKFLLFYRASDRVPVTGMKSVQMTIRPLQGPEILLPVAHTCFNLLDLPIYTSKKTLQERLHMAIETKGFYIL